MERPNRKSIIIASFKTALLFGFIFTTIYAKVPQDILWLKNLDEAKAQARQENKLIMADFWATWCAPCVQMEQRVWNQYGIRDLSAQYICLKIDYDKNRILARFYNVRAIPALLFLDNHGNKIAHVTGYIAPVQLEQIMKALPEDVTELYDLLDKVEKDKNNVESLITIADLYRSSGLHLISNQYYKRGLKSRVVKNNPDLLDYVWTYIGVNLLLINNHKQAKKIFEKRLKKFPASQNQPLQLFGLVKANSELGNQLKAQQYFVTLQDLYPNDKHTKWAVELLAE